jgi:hypothetical protein
MPAQRIAVTPGSAYAGAWAQLVKTLPYVRPERALDVGPGDVVLVIGAHPDDETFGAGAGVASLTRAGVRVHALGGYPDALHGEDQQLVDALDAAGYPIARTCRTTVTTSGRTHGRAAGGLADLLRRLESGSTTERLCGLDSQDSQDAANVRI